MSRNTSNLISKAFKFVTGQGGLGIGEGLKTLTGGGTSKTPLPPVIDAPTAEDLPPPVEDEDISKGAKKLSKRRQGAIGSAERRAVTSKSLLSDDFANTLLGN